MGAAHRGHASAHTGPREARSACLTMLAGVADGVCVLCSVTELILSIAFYWYNMIPLSRGSAAVGYTMILALFMAAGYEVRTHPSRSLFVCLFRIVCEAVL